MSEALKGMKWLKTTLLSSPDQDISPFKLVGAPCPARAPTRPLAPRARRMDEPSLTAQRRRRVRAGQAQLLDVSLQEATCVVSDGYHRTAAVLARDSLDSFREEFPGVWRKAGKRALACARGFRHMLAVAASSGGTRREQRPANC